MRIVSDGGCGAHEHRFVVDVVADEHGRGGVRASQQRRQGIALVGQALGQDVDDALAAETPERRLDPLQERLDADQRRAGVGSEAVVQGERELLVLDGDAGGGEVAGMGGDALAQRVEGRACPRRLRLDRDPRRRDCRSRSAARSRAAAARRRRCGR